MNTLGKLARSLSPNRCVVVVPVRACAPAALGDNAAGRACRSKKGKTAEAPGAGDDGPAERTEDSAHADAPGYGGFTPSSSAVPAGSYGSLGEQGTTAPFFVKEGVDVSPVLMGAADLEDPDVPDIDDKMDDYMSATIGGLDLEELRDKTILPLPHERVPKLPVPAHQPSSPQLDHVHAAKPGPSEVVVEPNPRPSTTTTTPWGPVRGLSVGVRRGFGLNGGVGTAQDHGQTSLSLGIVVGVHQTGHHYIKLLIPGQPAAQNGMLQEGDVLVSVNGVLFDGCSVPSASKLLRGQEGSSFSLLVNRQGREISVRLCIASGEKSHQSQSQHPTPDQAHQPQRQWQPKHPMPSPHESLDCESLAPSASQLEHVLSGFQVTREWVPEPEFLRVMWCGSHGTPQHFSGAAIFRKIAAFRTCPNYSSSTPWSSQCGLALCQGVFGVMGSAECEQHDPSSTAATSCKSRESRAQAL